MCAVIVTEEDKEYSVNAFSTSVITNNIDKVEEANFDESQVIDQIKALLDLGAGKMMTLNKEYLYKMEDLKNLIKI